MLVHSTNQLLRVTPGAALCVHGSVLSQVSVFEVRVCVRATKRITGFKLKQTTEKKNAHDSEKVVVRDAEDALGLLNGVLQPRLADLRPVGAAQRLRLELGGRPPMIPVTNGTGTGGAWPVNNGGGGGRGARFAGTFVVKYDMKYSLWGMG